MRSIWYLCMAGDDGIAGSRGWNGMEQDDGMNSGRKKKFGKMEDKGFQVDA